MGLETLAAVIGEEAVTIEDVNEPYLMQIGFLTRTPGDGAPQRPPAFGLSRARQAAGGRPAHPGRGAEEGLYPHRNVQKTILNREGWFDYGKIVWNRRHSRHCQQRI